MGETEIQRQSGMRHTARDQRAKDGKRQTKMWARRQRGDGDMERDTENGARRDKGIETEPSRGWTEIGRHGDRDTQRQTDRQGDRACGHRETKRGRHGLRNRGTQRLEWDVGGRGPVGIGGALTCPQICSWPLTPGRGCLCCCLHCLARALEEVTAWGGGRGRGRGVGRRGSSGAETRSRGPVACEYQSRSRPRGRAVGEAGVTVCHAVPPIAPSHSTQVQSHSHSQCHTKSHALSHGEAQPRVTHCVSLNVSLPVIYSRAISGHTQRA